MSVNMSTSRPYLIRALYEWIVDNQMTPYLLVDSDMEEVVAPRQYAQDGKIVLNIAPDAVQTLKLGNEYVEFSARFSGKAMDVVIPISATMAIYSRENGRGMVFNDDGGDETPPDGSGSTDKQVRSHLKLVK
jgi:stringent starvation protein B